MRVVQPKVAADAEKIAQYLQEHQELLAQQYPELEAARRLDIAMCLAEVKS